MERKDRRMFERFAVDFSVAVKLRGTETEGFARCCDISASGCDLLAKKGFTPGEDLEVWLGVPDGHRPLRGLAKVVWVKKMPGDSWRLGLEFKQVDFMGVRRILAVASKKNFS